MKKIRDLLLQNLGRTKYYDICDFVETLYLMNYDILILMARKFFNLFCVFHEINCEKYREMGIPYENKGKIVTNHALPLLRGGLRNNDYKKVIIADDFIIHGRSIKEVYDEVVKCSKDIEAKIVSYVCGIDEQKLVNGVKEIIYPKYYIDNAARRDLSDKLVKVFYLAGRPYISYLPYFVLDITWEQLNNKIEKENIIDIANDDMIRNGVYAFFYYGEDLDPFVQLDCCELCTIRFYYYSQIEKIIAIPYFVTRVLSESTIKIYSGYIREKYFTREYQLLVDNADDYAQEMRVMELEYAFSAWAAMYFFELYDIKILKWEKEIEHYNFADNLLSDTLEKADDIDKILMSVRQNVIKDNKTIDSIADGHFDELKKRYSCLKEHYIENYNVWKKRSSTWKDCNLNYKQRFLGNFMVVNGELDEKQCDDFSSTSQKGLPLKRLYGMPLTYLCQNLRDLWESCFIGEEEKIYHVFAEILKIADSGEGTIDTRIVGEKECEKYYESLIYAGELNFKFYEETYFPVMYGLYLIELNAAKRDIVDVGWKDKLIEDYTTYMNINNIFCDKEELLQIKELNITKEYGDFLYNVYNEYYENLNVREIVKMVSAICNK